MAHPVVKYSWREGSSSGVSESMDLVSSSRFEVSVPGMLIGDDYEKKVISGKSGDCSSYISSDALRSARVHLASFVGRASEVVRE